MAMLRVGSLPCGCSAAEHTPRFVAVTGGPGAGKTAVLELAVRMFCEHVAVLPESASVLFAGGFPRHDSLAGRSAIQRAIFHVQREVERLVAEERLVAVALCDRGTPDGLAYWPASELQFFDELGTTRSAECARYSAVVHLETPTAARGYDHSNPQRTEDPELARRIDERLRTVWMDHPRRFLIPSTVDFMSKVRATLEVVRAELPPCCHSHPLEPPAERRETGGPP